MNTPSIEDLFALEELGELTWAWTLRYATEKGLEHGNYYVQGVNPYNNTYYTVDGYTIREAVHKFKEKITVPVLQIPDYP
jgi:hypothetical protein